MSTAFEKRLKVTQPDEAYRLNVIGVPGEGKSEYRNQFLTPIYRVTLWNPMEDLNIGETITVEQYIGRIDEMKEGSLRVTVAPQSYDERGMAFEYDKLCGAVEEVGNQHFATEEIALVASPTRVPENLNRLCIRGRHSGISLSWYGQRFHQFPLIVRSTASEIIAFRQTDPDDVKDFEKRISPDVSPVPLNQLPKHHFLRWTPENGVQFCAPLHIESKPKEANRHEQSYADDSRPCGTVRCGK